MRSLLTQAMERSETRSSPRLGLRRLGGLGATLSAKCGAVPSTAAAVTDSIVSTATASAVRSPPKPTITRWSMRTVRGKAGPARCVPMEEPSPLRHAAAGALGASHHEERLHRL